MAGGEIAGEDLEAIAGAGEAETLGEVLGGAVEVVDIVVDVVEVVADLLVGQQRARSLFARGRQDGRVAGRLQPLTESARRLVQPQEGAGEGRTVGGDALEVLQARRRVGEKGVGRGFAQVGNETVDVVGGEGGEIHPEGLPQGNENARGHRALVVLDLVEVADRESEPLRKGRLGQTRLFTQPAQGRTDENLPRHGAASCPDRLA